MFAHDVFALFRHTIQLFKGTNHKQVIPTLIVAHDPIDKKAVALHNEMNDDMTPKQVREALINVLDKAIDEFLIPRA